MEGVQQPTSQVFFSLSSFNVQVEAAKKLCVWEVGKPFALTDLSLSSSFQLNQKEFPISKRAPVPGLFLYKEESYSNKKNSFSFYCTKIQHSTTTSFPRLLLFSGVWTGKWKKKGKFSLLFRWSVWNTKECYAALEWSVWGWGNTTCTKINCIITL